MLIRRMGAKKPTVYAPPTTLSQSGNSSSSVTLQWTNSVSQPVEVYFDGALVSTRTAGQTSYTKTGLSDATVYSVKLRYKNGSAYSPFTVAVNMATSLPTPGTPSTSVHVRTVTLTWTNTTNLADIEIWRDGGSGYSLVTTVAAGNTTYDDAGLSDGTYNYKLRYTLTGNTSSYSSAGSAVVAASVNAPTSPSATAITYSQIDLAWTLGTAGAATEIYRGTSTNPTTLVHTTAEGDTSWSDIGLTESTHYYYRFKGIKDAVESTSYSSEVSDTTPANLPGPSGPPTGLSKTIPYTDKVSLSWTDADSDSDIEIYRGTSPSPTTLLHTVSATGTSYDDTTVVAGTTYYYRLRHVRNSQYSAYTSDVTAAVPNNAFTSQSITANPGDSFVTLGWAILYGPEGATVDVSAWTDTDGDGGDGATGITSPYEVELGFTLVGKAPGTNHEITISMSLIMKNSGGSTVLTDSSFSVGSYKPNEL